MRRIPKTATSSTRAAGWHQGRKSTTPISSQHGQRFLRKQGSLDYMLERARKRGFEAIARTIHAQQGVLDSKPRTQDPTSPRPEKTANANASARSVCQASGEQTPSATRSHEAPLCHSTGTNPEVAGIEEHFLSPPHSTRPVLRTGPKTTGANLPCLEDPKRTSTAPPRPPGRSQEPPAGTRAKNQYFP